MSSIYALPGYKRKKKSFNYWASVIVAEALLDDLSAADEFQTIAIPGIYAGLQFLSIGREAAD